MVTGPVFNYSGGQRPVDVTRYAELFTALGNCLCVGAFRNAVNVGGGGSYFDLTIGESFIGTWRTFQSGATKASNEAAFKLIQDIQRLLGFESFAVSPSADGHTLQIIIDGRSYRLDEVGAGLAQLIVALANAAVKRPSYILIDEPELNLHPSLQLDFLTTLGSHASEGVVFATHSIGLARSAAERIYSVRARARGESEIRPFESTPALAEVLGELSYSGYAELGFNRVLLVEGTTDVKALQQLLRLYGKDHKVVMIPLGGSQLIGGGREIELSELKRIAPSVMALIDSERGGAGASLDAQRTAFVSTCRDVGIECHVLERRAFENYLTDRAVKAVKGESYRALEAYEQRASVSPVWGKAENWLIAREMTKEEIADTDVGRFLDAL